MGNEPESSPPAESAAFLEDSAEDLYENAPCGYLSALPGGLIVKVNQTLLSWTGYRREQLVGTKRFQDLLTAGGKIFHETHFLPLLLMQGSVREIAVDLVRADGSRLPTLINSVVKSDDAGAPAVIRTTVFNATDRREYERELVRARRAAEQAEVRARVLARTFQESLIPPTLPAVPGLQVAGIYRPAGRGDEVGGDFYDVFEVGRDDWALVVGDVCGKGARAAVVTSVARHTLRVAAMRSRRPKLGLAVVNEELMRQQPGHFCSIVYARVRRHPSGRLRLTVTSGGHPLPLRVTSSGVAHTIGLPGMILGVLDAPTLRDSTIELRVGDVVLFFTDGVTEARRDGEFFDDERLVTTMRRLRSEHASVVAERIGDEVVAFQEGLPRDDIALLVLKVPEV